jgi:hypothetical protein
LHPPKSGSAAHSGSETTFALHPDQTKDCPARNGINDKSVRDNLLVNIAKFINMHNEISQAPELSNTARTLPTKPRPRDIQTQRSISHNDIWHAFSQRIKIAIFIQIF